MNRFRLFETMVALMLVTRALSGQVGCTYHQTCTNPVPASDISFNNGVNYWQDTYYDTWYVTSSGGSVSGTVEVPNPGCPTVVFTVSGSISPSAQVDGTQGSTAFTWNASNPNPSSTCGGYTPVPFTYTGTIQNDGNDLAPNTSWQNSSGGGSGTTTVTKSPSDIPSSETTMAVGFGSGLYATVGQFRQILNASNGSTDIFEGRQVSEYQGFGTSYDNCWFQGSQVPKLTILGSMWNVGYYAIDPPYITSLNEWVDDYIGWNSTQVTYYQSHYYGNSPLCGARLPQGMAIAYNGTSGDTQTYTTDTLGEDIYTNQVTAYRAGVSQSATWPQQ